MSDDSDEDRGLFELNHRSREARVKNGVVDEEWRLVEEEELKSSGVVENVRGGRGGAVQAQVVMQQPQGSTVCWERFLHVRSLKVLLVEYDDCTRHIVAALLRNCSYEVIEAANGLQAWKVLEDLANHVDLVLTEVVMPCLSGVGLLNKIMSHKTRKNVPVIMMSSHDSMGLVFKCLSKGAVDFLVKPIRKNELKNLWQHIWRRCHSSSGSGTGSESGTQTQKSVKSKSVDKFENNSGSNDNEDDESTDLNVGDGSDNGSGTQSSWTKRAEEVDSPRQVFLWPNVAECPDSTCAQVVHSNAETIENKLVPATATRESQKQKEQHDNLVMGQDLEIGMCSNRDLQLEQRNEFSTKPAGTRQQNLLGMGSNKFDEQIDKGQLSFNCESPSTKLKYDSSTTAGGVADPTDPQIDSTQFDTSNRHYNAIDMKNKGSSDTNEEQSVELSLKRLRGVKGTETTVQDDRNVFRRSDSSAFSRYNTASNANKAPSGHVGSNSPHGNSGEVTKSEYFHDTPYQSSDNPPYPCSKGGSNNIDVGSTTNNAFPNSLAINKLAAASTVHLLRPSSAFHPVKKDHKSTTQKVLVENADNVSTTALAQSRGTQKQLQVQNLHRDYDQHHAHHHVVHTMQGKQRSDHDGSSLKKLAAAAPHCGSSNVLSGPVQGNPGNYSVNGSGSGSNHGSNGQNGSSTGINVGGKHTENEHGVAGKSGSGDASGNQSGNRVDENKLKQREAALIKFRQKRNERCFRKKVRYQSRKKLAEQRPRIRGQFVRQTVSENNTSRTTDS